MKKIVKNHRNLIKELIKIREKCRKLIKNGEIMLKSLENWLKKLSKIV